MSKVLVFIEQRDGNVKKASLETLSKAVALFGADNTEALCINGGGISLSSVAAIGCSKVTSLHSADLAQYSSSAYAGLTADFFSAGGFSTLFCSNTAMGRDLAPRVAVRKGAGLFVDCTSVELEGGTLSVTRPIYAGKANQKATAVTALNVVTLRPNVFPVVNGGSESPVTETAVSNADVSTRVTSVKKSEGKLDVAEANIIVSGGRGMKGPENFHLIESLAESLGAAVGASRAVVDAGWRPHSEQVGQTGKTVSPTLYVAVGISGAIQHLAGMSSSKYIVAINKDKEAPIFSVADYGIAGDAFEILPVLTEEIKKIKQ